MERTLCDNIIYSKYSTSRKIKDIYDISLLEYFGIYDKVIDQIEAFKKNYDFGDTPEYHINKEIIHASSRT